MQASFEQLFTILFRCIAAKLASVGPSKFFRRMFLESPAISLLR